MAFVTGGVFGIEHHPGIILGSGYEGVYAMGDVLTMSLLQKELELVVTGFLSPNVSLDCNGETYELDEYIIMPFFDLDYQPTGDEDEVFQKRYYTQKNDGLIRIDNSLDPQAQETYDQYLTEIETLSTTTGVHYTIAKSPTTGFKTEE